MRSENEQNRGTKRKNESGKEPVGKHRNELELPELLDTISLELKDKIYVDDKQKYTTMGQIRLLEWTERYKNNPTALTKTSMEFVHKKKGAELVTRKLRTTVRLTVRHLAVDIYLVEGNSNLVLGREFLQEAEMQKQGTLLKGLEDEKDILMHKDEKAR